MSAGKISGLGKVLFTSKTFGKSQEPVTEVPLDALKKSFGDVGSRSSKTISSQKANLILKRLLGKMKGDFGKKADGTQKSSNLRYQSSKFKDLFAKLILVEPFSNCLFGKDGCFNEIPADVISLLNTAEPLKDLAKKAREATPVQLKYLLLSLGKDLSNSLLSHSDKENSNLFISDTHIKDLLKHLGCSAQLDRLDRATCLAFLSKYHTDTHVTEASQFYAQPVLVFANQEEGSTHSTDSRFPQRVVAGTHVEEVEDDRVRYEVPVHTDNTHLATALGFTPQFFDCVSVDPTTKLHNNQIVIHPTDPGKFAVSMKSDKGQAATYPLAFDQESGSWMLLGKPLAEFLPQVVLTQENLYEAVVDSQPIYANIVSGVDYSFRVNPYSKDGLGVTFSLNGNEDVRNFSNCLDAVGFAHKLTVAADAKLPVALFEHFRPEKMGGDQRSDVVAKSDYSFWLSPHQADSNETNPPQFMVTYFLGGEIKERSCASLQEASQFSARLLKAQEIKLPPNLFQFFKLGVPQYSDISNGEMLVYPLVRPEGDIAFGLLAKALDGVSAAVYEHNGISVSNYRAWVPTQSLHDDVISMPLLAPLGDVMVFHGLKDPLVGNEEFKRPDYVNLFANPNRSVSPNGSKLSTTILEAIQFGGKRVGFIASSDPLEKTNGVDFYRVVKEQKVGLIVRLNVSQGKEYFPSGEGEAKTLGDATAGGVATVETISLQEYKFSGLEKLKYDKAQYPGFDPKDLKLEVRNLLVDGTHPVIHLNLAGWPDHKAIPPEVLKVVKEFIRKLVKENNIQNMLGHCRAGVGRTGTLYEALRMKDGPVSREEVAKSIEATRADRGQMVQDSVQFLSLVNFGSFSGDNPVLLVAEAVANAAPPPVPARPVKPAVNPLINQDNAIFFNGKLNLVSQHNHSEAKLLILNNKKKEGNDLKNFYVLRTLARGGYALTYSISGNVNQAILTVLDRVWSVNLPSGNLTVDQFLSENHLSPIVLKSEALKSGNLPPVAVAVTVGGETFAVNLTATRDNLLNLQEDGKIIFRPTTVNAVKDAGGYAFSHFKDGKWSHYLCRKEGNEWKYVNDKNEILRNLDDFLKSLRTTTIKTPGKGVVTTTKTGGDIHVTTKKQTLLGTGSFGAVKDGTVTVTDTEFIGFIRESGIEYSEITQDGKPALVIKEGLVAKKIELQMMNPTFIQAKISSNDYTLQDNHLILNCSVSHATSQLVAKDKAVNKDSVRLEAEMGGRFNHPNLGRTVAVSDVYSNGKLHVMHGGTRYQLWAKGVDGKPAPVPTVKMFMLQEAIKGKELFHVVTKSPAPSEVLKMKWFFQILAGLEHMHSKEVAHRDIKLENVMIDEKGNVKIMDFGFSREPGHPDFKLVQGTPGYASPEILECKVKVGEEFQVDAFAAAALGFAMFFNHNLSSPYLGDADFSLSSISKASSESTALGALRGLLIKMGHADPTQRLSVVDCIAKIKQDTVLGPLYLAAVPPPLPAKQK